MATRSAPAGDRLAHAERRFDGIASGNETNELERRLRERLNVLGPAPAPSCFTSCCFPTSSRWTDLQGHAAVASVTTEPEAERHAVAFTGLQRTVVCWFKREVRGDRGPWFERQR
jgi:hypothetical protein